MPRIHYAFSLSIDSNVRNVAIFLVNVLNIVRSNIAKPLVALMNGKHTDN